MIKHILVPGGGLPNNPALLEEVFALARPFSAHVEVLHTRRDPRNGLSLYEECFSAEDLQEVIDEAERNARKTAEAARRLFEEALAGVVSSIPRARTVSILVTDEGPMNAVLGGREQPQPERLVDHLARHGVQAIARHVGRESRLVGAALADAARELNAGLLVMGGYGHSRMREVVLGRATRHLLMPPVEGAVLPAH